MSTITEERRLAKALPKGDVVGVLLKQHARIRELFDELEVSVGADRKRLFDELRKQLALHEAAEELVLRPVSRRVAGAEVVGARNDEEAEATHALEALERLDPAEPEFDSGLAALRRMVEDHADAEEVEEFPRVLAEVDDKQRQALGALLKGAELVGPTHAHPKVAGSSVAQLTVGPFAAMLDRARDLLRRAG